MRRIEAGGAILAAAITLSACGAPRQVGELNLVNCQDGPKTATTDVKLKDGQDLYIGGASGFLGEWFRQPLKLVSQGNGDFVIKNLSDTTGVNYRADLDVPQDSDLPIKAGGVTVNPDHSIVFNSNNIDFHISASNQDGSTNLTIQEACTK